MRAEEELFLKLLRAGLYGEPLDEAQLPARIDWEGVAALADKHGVLGTIAESVECVPEGLRPTGDVARRMGRFALGLIQTNLILDRTVGRLVATLRGEGVEGVLLKGQGVARYYRKPQMRQSGDIDFYVGRREYGRAVEVCRRVLKDYTQPSTVSEQHYTFYTDGVEVELHRLAARMHSKRRDKALQEWIAGELEDRSRLRRLRLGETDVWLPGVDFDALYIFYHGWSHLITGGIGLRQLCDWAMILTYRHAEIDLRRLEENVARLGLTAGWKLFGYIAVRYLGVAEENVPLYDPRHARRYDKVMEDIMTGGNFGYHSAAGIRMTNRGEGLGDKLGKLRSIVEYCAAIFPIVPAEATAIMMGRLREGTANYMRRLTKGRGKGGRR